MSKIKKEKMAEKKTNKKRREEANKNYGDERKKKLFPVKLAKCQKRLRMK